MSLQKNDLIELEITGLTSEGAGIGHYEGEAVFVPFSAPGDHLKVKIVKPMKTYAYGIIQAINSSSDFRIENKCLAYKSCGGCTYQHIQYEAELSAKMQVVVDAMQRIGKIDTEIMPIIPSPEQVKYRNKAIYPVRLVDGEPKVGFFASRSHRLVPIADCLLQPNLLNEIAQYICSLLLKHNISVYDETTHRGLMRNIYLRKNSDNSEVMVCLVLNGAQLPHAGQVCRQLVDEYPQIVSIMVNVNTQQTNVILGKKFISLLGADTITDHLADIQLQLSPSSFYQINHAATEKLYSIVKEFAALQQEDILLDLYCGVGAIGLSLAKNCASLIGVEVVDSAVQMANLNAKKNNISNAKFICADAGTAATDLANSGLLPDVIIVDPPRKGCDGNTLTAIIDMAPKRLVMISCNPATAARDAAILREYYTVTKIQPVDMFPRTKHVECVVLMSRVSD